MVTDVVTTQYSYSYYKQIINSSDSSSNSGISSVMTNIIDTVYSSLADTYGRQYLMSNFDSNNDNILDGVWMVYNIEEDETGKTICYGHLQVGILLLVPQSVFIVGLHMALCKRC